MKVIIIGAGIAGLTAAIIAYENGDDVVLLDKNTELQGSASAWARGGIVYKARDDSPALLSKDIFLAADSMAKKEAVEFLSKHGPAWVETFLIKKIKVPFDKKIGKKQGILAGHEFLLTKEALHSRNRILFSGDKTGFVIISHIIEYLKKNTKVQVLQKHIALDLINIPHHSKDPMAVYEKPQCVGVYALDLCSHKVQVHKFFADKIILASGGIGQIYKETTNPASATGDGIAIASRAKARIINMEFTQFHPTALAHKKAGGFLVSEALRGEGGKVVNESGYEFVKDTDPRGSLAPRDSLSRAILREQIKTAESHFYLSMQNTGINIQTRFPELYKKCLELDIDVRKQNIPITPAFHYSCGGVLTDLHAKTTVARLYAIGECACNGVHGANRLASTSLLEGLLFAREAALDKPYKESGSGEFSQEYIEDWKKAHESKIIDPVLIHQGFSSLKSIMWNYVGIIRKPFMLSLALKELRGLKERSDMYYREGLLSREIIELRNSIQTAIIVTDAAIKNPISRGGHFLKN